MMSNQSFRLRMNCSAFSKWMKRCWDDERGATAIEYGLMSSLIGIMLISAAGVLGGDISQTFTDISTLLSGPSEPPVAAADAG